MRQRSFLITAGTVGILGLGGMYGCHRLERNHVQQMLNLRTLPASVSGLDCASFGFTDVLERCSFQVAPDDFPRLLKSSRYERVPLCQDNPSDRSCWSLIGPETSHNFCCGPGVGPDFRIAAIYSTQPAEFEHGGSITIVTDAAHRQVMVDLYIE